jgi:glycosyltransferase involved in cell wall biosynthesis
LVRNYEIYLLKYVVKVVTNTLEIETPGVLSKYVIIMPVYNEEHFLSMALDSLISQTLLPSGLIIVDDGSQDSTSSIAESYASKYPWIQVLRNPGQAYRAVGAKVVRAFNLGCQAVKQEYDFMVKLDADVSLPPRYFETIARHFQQKPRLGIVGGRVMNRENGRWVPDLSIDPDHIWGLCKSYRAGCLRDMGGLRSSMGWDTADELLARYYGWQTFVDPDLEIRHHRKMGSMTGSLKIQRRIGQGMYRLRYGFLITLVSSLKAGYRNRPYGLTGMMVLMGWVYSWCKGDTFIVSREQGKFIREFRRGRMTDKIRAFSSGRKPCEG